MDGSIKTDLKESYERNARLRDREEIVAWKVNEMDKFLKCLHKEKKTTLLDIGAGAGQYGKYFKDRGLHVSCIDFTKEMVLACLEKGLDAYVMDFYNIDFQGHKFDSAWALNTLLHVPKNSFEKILLNIKRNLTPDGLLYIGVYGGFDFEGIWEDDFYTPKRFFSFYKNDAIKNIVEKFFKIEEFSVISLEASDMDFQSMILRKL